MRPARSTNLQDLTDEEDAAMFPGITRYNNTVICPKMKNRLISGYDRFPAKPQRSEMKNALIFLTLYALCLCGTYSN